MYAENSRMVRTDGSCSALYSSRFTVGVIAHPCGVMGFCESFNGTMANELLNIEVSDSLFEAEVLIKMWVMSITPFVLPVLWATNHPLQLLGCNQLDLAKSLHPSGTCFGAHQIICYGRYRSGL